MARLAAAVLQERARDALLVAAVTQLPEELVHEVAAVGEDQDTTGARRLHEPERRNRLAGPGGVLEPEAAGCPRVLLLGVGGSLLLCLLGGIPVERLLVGQLVALQLDLAGVELLERGAAPAVAADQQLRLERDQRARQGVDLVRRQRRAVGQVRLLLGEQALEAQHQRELAPPLDRGLTAAGVQLLQSGVERGAARTALRERDDRILAFEHEGLTREFLGALQFVAGNRRGIGHGASLSHG